MNKYKIQNIVNYIQRMGRLPTDQFGQILSADDILSWHGLDELLDPAERVQIKCEIQSLIEAQVLVDQLALHSF